MKTWFAGLVLVFYLAPCPALAETLSGRCTSVTDGDTVQLTTAGKQTYKIRLHGIDAPEKKQAFGCRQLDGDGDGQACESRCP